MPVTGGGRPWRAMLLGALLGVAVPGAALACSCVRLAPEGFRQQADVILWGRVERVVPVRGGQGLRATVRVLHAVKGRTARVIRVETGAHSAACGVEMVPGQGAEYLLMRRGPVYSTNLCLMLGARSR